MREAATNSDLKISDIVSNSLSTFTQSVQAPSNLIRIGRNARKGESGKLPTVNSIDDFLIPNGLQLHEGGKYLIHLHLIF